MSRGPALATAAAGLALLGAAPAPPAALATLTTPAAATEPLAPLLALIALAAWALLSWLLTVGLVTAATRLPGGLGRAATSLAQRLAPAAVRRVVSVALGLTVVAGGIGASPASADTHLPPAPPAVAASLDWPTAPPSPAAPSLDRHPSGPPQEARRVPVPVVVQPGDSLWAVAAEHLPAGAGNAQIAQAWPAWWSANRAAVGPDPDLIHPGLSLTPPAQR